MRCPTLKELPLPPAGKNGWPWTEESPQLPDYMPCGRPWPKISIITPNYNYAQFIEETIRSVLLQGYPDLEYVVIDDGSFDNSVEIIKKYARWLTYWETGPNRGQTYSIDKGAKYAKGEWINWLNSDDFLLPGALKSVGSNAVAVSGSVNGIIFGCYVVRDESKNIEKVFTPRRPAYVSSFFNYRNPPVIPQPSTFIRSDKFKINAKYNYVMDWVLYLVMENEEPNCFKTCDGIIASFRLHDKSNTVRRPGQFNREAIAFLNNYRFSRRVDRVAAKRRLRLLKLRTDISIFLDTKGHKSLMPLLKILLKNPDAVRERMFWGALKRVLI